MTDLLVPSIKQMETNKDEKKDIIKYKRKCPNWIEAFMAWTIPRSEVATEFIQWTALWTIAAALRRRVYIPKEAGLGSWTCYPYLYIMFVAPPGYRKTTTVSYAIELLEKVPNFPLPPTLITLTGLVDDIKNAPESSIYLTMEEFGDLIIKGGKEMYEFLTSMYDGKKALRQKTMLRGLESAEKPTINLLAGTTPEWISDNIPRSLLGGGFASRVIWVYGDKLRRRRLYYTPEELQCLKLQPFLQTDLNHIATLNGEVKLPEDSKLFMENWYQELEQRYRGFKYPGYLNRKHVLAHKIAIICKAAYSDELSLDIEDFQNAIYILESVESKLGLVFQGVGKNEYSLEMRDIVQFITDKGRVQDTTLREHFQNAASPAKLEELLQGVLLIGKVKVETQEDPVSKLMKRYFLPEKK